MQENKKGYWEQKNHQQVNIFPTYTIVHPFLDVVAVKYVHDIPRFFCNRNQSKQALQIHPLFLTDSYNDYTLEDIEHRAKIEYEGNISVDGDEE